MYKKRKTEVVPSSLTLYFRELSNIPLLSEEETLNLVNKYRNGDTSAAQKLCEHNLRLVVPVAKCFQHNGLDLEDLIQVGNLGLMKAIEHYKPDMDCKLSTYSRYWIRQSISREIDRHGKIIYMPKNKLDDIKIYQSATHQARQKLNEEPTIEYMAGFLGWTVDKTIETFCYAQKNISLQTTFVEDENSVQALDFEHTLPDASISIKQEHKDAIEDVNELLKLCNEKERKILSMYYGVDGYDKMTMQEIANEYGVTRQCISEYLIKTTRKLKERLKNV